MLTFRFVLLHGRGDGSLRWRGVRCLQIRLAAIDNDLHVVILADVSVLKPLPRLDTSLLGVDLEKADAAGVATVARVSAKADAAGIAHPQGRRLLDTVGMRVFVIGGDDDFACMYGDLLVTMRSQGAVIVDVVTAS